MSCDRRRISRKEYRDIGYFTNQSICTVSTNDVTNLYYYHNSCSRNVVKEITIYLAFLDIVVCPFFFELRTILSNSDAFFGFYNLGVYGMHLMDTQQEK